MATETKRPDQTPDILRGDATNSDAQVSDGDKFVHNRNGVVKQNSVGWLFNYIKSKCSINTNVGAVCTIFTDKLTAYSAVVVNNVGNIISHPNVTATHLSNLIGCSSALVNVTRAKVIGFVSPSGAGTVSLGSFSVSKPAVGTYVFTGIPYTTLSTSQVYIESISDDDNVHVVYDKTTTGFTVKFFDIPNMTAQDTNFRFAWSAST